jgi:flagellar hook protein FlgE
MGFQQGLSGLNAAARNLDVIGNNVANTNTVGAKSARAEFADLYANSLLGGGNNSIGIGVTLSDVAQQFTQGTSPRRTTRWISRSMVRVSSGWTRTARRRTPETASSSWIPRATSPMPKVLACKATCSIRRPM